MMMDKKQRVLMKKRHFIKRVKRILARIDLVITDEGVKRTSNVNWKDFINGRDFVKYRTTSTPCSCYMCSGYKKYKREKYKNEFLNILKEEF